MPFCARRFAFATYLTVGTTAALAAAPNAGDGKPGPDRASPGYVSAFAGYRTFGDQPVIAWREANDLVGRIGGWQAYARESQGIAGGPQAGAPPMSSPTPAPAKPGEPPPASHSHGKQ